MSPCVGRNFVSNGVAVMHVGRSNDFRWKPAEYFRRGHAGPSFSVSIIVRRARW